MKFTITTRPAKLVAATTATAIFDFDTFIHLPWWIRTRTVNAETQTLSTAAYELQAYLTGEAKARLRSLQAGEPYTCEVGDLKYAHYPSDEDANLLRKVTLQRQQDDCGWWVKWEHKPDLCTGNENSFWGDNRRDNKGNYCSYPPQEVFDSSVRSQGRACPDECSSGGGGKRGGAGEDRAFGNQVQFVITAIFFAIAAFLIFMIFYIGYLAAGPGPGAGAGEKADAEGGSSGRKYKTSIEDVSTDYDLESGYEESDTRSYVTHGGVSMRQGKNGHLKVHTGLTPSSAKGKKKMYGNGANVSPSWSPTNGERGGHARGVTPPRQHVPRRAHDAVTLDGPDVFVMRAQQAQNRYDEHMPHTQFDPTSGKALYDNQRRIDIEYRDQVARAQQLERLQRIKQGNHNHGLDKFGVYLEARQPVYSTHGDGIENSQQPTFVFQSQMEGPRPGRSMPPRNAVSTHNTPRQTTPRQPFDPTSQHQHRASKASIYSTQGSARNNPIGSAIVTPRGNEDVTPRGGYVQGYTPR